MEENTNMENMSMNMNPTNMPPVKAKTGKGLVTIIVIIIIIAIAAIIALKMMNKDVMTPEEVQSEIDLTNAATTDSTDSISASLNDINLDDPTSQDIKSVDTELQNL